MFTSMVATFLLTIMQPVCSSPMCVHNLLAGLSHLKGVAMCLINTAGKDARFLAASYFLCCNDY